MAKTNTINLFLTGKQAEELAKALEQTMPEFAKSLRERIPLEGLAPWRRVAGRREHGNPGLGGHTSLREVLECGHTYTAYASNQRTIAHAEKRRCQECQDDLRRAAGWTEWQIEDANK